MNYSQEEMCLIALQHTPVGAWRGIDKLLEHYGTALALWTHLQDPGVLEQLGEKTAHHLLSIREKGLDSLLSALDRVGAQAVTSASEEFPSRLQSLSDPPRVLFFRGKIPSGRCPAVAVIGARRDTRYGRNQAYRIARELAENGVVIVSGLARGIDTAAHSGALDAGGITVAVLGNGISSVYPPENRDLCERLIASGGAVISEYAPDSDPLGFHFPIRNRLISGLSDALLLIEAQRKSGTASTVHHALSQGKEIFALPGNVDAPGSELPLQLLREGAHLCISGQDILQEMSWDRKEKQLSLFDPPSADKGTGEATDPVLEALRLESKTFEELSEELRMSPQELGARLTMLELEGTIERLGGRTYTLSTGRSPF